MIATCTNPRCSFLFDTPGISIINSKNIVMQNNSVTCPKCFSVAKLLDGTFNFDKDGLATFLSGPQITFEILNQLRLLTETAINEEFSSEIFIERAKSINPIFEFLKSFIPEDKKEFRSIFYPFLMVLIPLLISKMNDDDHDNVTNNIYYNTYNVGNRENKKPSDQKNLKSNAKKVRNKRKK